MFSMRSKSARLLVASVGLVPLLFQATAFAARPGGGGPNTAPTISGAPATSTVVNAAYFFQPTAYDAEGDRLSFAIANKPAWASFNKSSGRLAGTPTTSGTSAPIQITVSDGRLTAALPAFTITVSAPVAVNRAPTISGSPATSVAAGSSYLFRPTAADADGDTLTFSISGKPAWASFDASTGTLHGTPLATDAGTSTGVVIAVSDGKAQASLAPFALTVTPPPNRAPTISGTPVTSGQAGRPYAFQPSATDADGDPLTFSISGKPSWATFDVATGTLFGTPASTDVGSYANVVVGVSDGRATAALPGFTITVAQAPTRSVTLNWTSPTQNTDGSALTDLAGYTVFYGTASRQYSTSVRLQGAGTSTVVLEGIAPGTWYFSIKSVNNSGVESDYSGEVVAVL